MDTLHFERYEHKYIVPEAMTDPIRDFIRPYVVADGNAARQDDGRYTICSIYLDTPRMDFFRAAIDGAVDRVKLRIRWYDALARGPFFLEVKRKIRRVIVKDRVRITRDDVDSILRGDPLSFPDGPVRDRLTGFVDRMVSGGAAPVIQCRYTREPYESVFGDYARLTFDRAVCFQDVVGHELLGNPRGWSYVDAGWSMNGVRCATILELKFTAEFPRWMTDLVAEFGLERVGYSKYCSAILHRANATGAHLGFESCAATGR